MIGDDAYPFSENLSFANFSGLPDDNPDTPFSVESSSSSEKVTPLKFLRSSFQLKPPKIPSFAPQKYPEASQLNTRERLNMSALIKIRPFKGTNDGSEDPNDFLEDIECAAEAFECQKNPATSSMEGIERSQKRFFRQYLSEDGDAAYWWQFVLLPEEKTDYLTIKKRFLQRYGTKAIAARSQFEIQNEVMALRQNPGESIASYVRTAEKLSKRVPAELDSVLALCLIKGMQDEAKKADISYIVHSRKETTFRDVVGIIKAKYRVIGEPDPFGRCDVQKSTSNWGHAYVAPTGGSTQIPVVAAGRMGNVPSYNISRRTTGMAESIGNVGGQMNENYGDRSLDSALNGCGISPEQFKGLMDWYLQERSKTDNQTPPNRQDFRLPALPTPGVINPALGDRQPSNAPATNTPPYRNYGNNTSNTAPLNVSCFACGRRGHYSMTCPYPPLPPHEQEHLREAARISRLQRAGLPATRVNTNGPPVANSVQIETHDPQRNEDNLPTMTHLDANEKGSGVRESPVTARITKIEPSPTVGSHAERISSACAILSRLPSVMAVIQDVMANKRTRTQAEEDTEWLPENRANKAPRVQQTVAESIDEGNADNDEDMLDRVVVRPRPQTTSTDRRTTARSVLEEVDVPVESSRTSPANSNIVAGEADAQPLNPISLLTSEVPDNERDGRGEKSRNTLPYAGDLEDDTNTRVPDWLRDIRKKPATVSRALRPAPINLMKGLNPYDIGEAMVRVKPEISFPQLLDVSPRLRRELALLLRSSQPRTRKKKIPVAQIDKVAGPIQVTNAAPDTDVECMYISVWCQGVEIPDVLVDGGAMIDLIAQDVADKLGLEKHPVNDLGMRLADDSLVPLESYVWLDVNVEGVVARVRAYVMPVTVTYKILLSRRWLKRIRGVEHHATNTLLIQGIDGIQRSTKGRPAPPAELEIVPMTENTTNNAEVFNAGLRDDDESADDAVDALLHELDDWDLKDHAGNGEHRR